MILLSIISAKERIGFDKLLTALQQKLPETAKRMKLLVPYDPYCIYRKIREDGRIFSEEYTENGTLIDALVDIKLVKEAQGMII